MFLLDFLDLATLLFQVKQKGRSVKSFKPPRDPPWSILTEWRRRVQSTPHSPFLGLIPRSWDDRRQSVSFLEVDEASNQVANAILRLCSSKKAPVIAVLLPNDPFFVTCWIGIAKTGGVSGLINANLRGKGLAHAVKTCLGEETGERYFIVGAEFCDRLEDEDVRSIMKELSVQVLLKEGYNSNTTATDRYKSFDRLLFQASTKCPSSLLFSPRYNSTLLYIYTSGTTGLPKASRITHLRFWAAGRMFSTISHLSIKDNIYCALPLYHSAGGMMGVSGCILSGSCLVIRPKFSASKFAEDLVKTECTVLQYIGEFGRFALMARESEYDEELRKRRRLRVAFGNGMREDVWERFRKRFGIGKIIEIYGSTEGNANLVNNTSKIGAIGIVPPFLQCIYPILLVQTDQETNEILRHPETDLAIPCRVNQPGQLLGLISNNDPSRMFEGYTDATSTKKKIVRNVRRHGDEWFTSGDLLKRDAWGFYYWVDRIGDTFRWKGENVSTVEVEKAFGGGMDVNVYGVIVPGYPGRVGMARLMMEEKIDMGKLYERLEKQLPLYAVPLFLRLGSKSSLDGEEMMTSTFKHKKHLLVKDGFDPKRCGGEVIYWRDDKKKTFVMLADDDYDKICSGELRV